MTHKYQHEFDRWFRAQGDSTLRLQYPLTENSVVFDAGGYKGDFAAKIYNLYKCEIHVFEPEPNFADYIEKRFSQNPKIFIHRYALGEKNTKAALDVKGDGTSVTQLDGRSADDAIVVRDIADVVESIGVKHIDLFKINIEGGEFPLMNRCLDTGLVDIVENFQIQYHNFVPNAEQKRDSINREMIITHRCDYNFTFVWEGWSKRG